MDKINEQILVIRRSSLFGGVLAKAPQGIITDKDTVDDWNKRLNLHIDVMRRGDAEEDPTFKQPIPYCVIRRGDQIFGYLRLGGGGEARLHGKVSIGVGGHMNPNDEGMGIYSWDDLLMMNLERELNEEVYPHYMSISPYEEDPDIDLFPKVIGFVNDDSDDVGKVHLGILVQAEVPSDVDVSVRETDQLEGRWFTKEELLNGEYELEGWSRMVLEVM